MEWPSFIICSKISGSFNILFPTQKKLYDKLQKIPGHENDCGRQGVNGGYIKNPHVKFGVNCYGKKPKKTDIDDEYFNQVKVSYSASLTEDELNKIGNYKLIINFHTEVQSSISLKIDKIQSK